ncbi:hypothetical protein [Streptomyces chiangmaiensis]|uniref:hypothetical protein n=1 Tax=Streptomyces chiangmaiensis TaxID=766497 RepID=UPI002E366118|nr:hypothetical protein [Streptomyces chiangmaiensis]
MSKGRSTLWPGKIQPWHLVRLAVVYVRPSTPDSYLAGLHLRASMIWIKDLTRATH